MVELLTRVSVGAMGDGRLGPAQMQCGRQRGNAVVKGVRKKVENDVRGNKSDLSNRHLEVYGEDNNYENPR